MVSKLLPHHLSDQMFKLKQKTTQASYLSFALGNVLYAINIQNIVNIIEGANLIYLSHMSPPIVGMHYSNNMFIPILDFAGYRPHSKQAKLLILSNNSLKKDQNFGLSVDAIDQIMYFKESNLIKNAYPFNNLLPSYFYAYNRDNVINFIDTQDLFNQIEP